jgi:lipopolysaccharide/colanic/teichoic acid biosynthesis glycosyltransferase
MINKEKKTNLKHFFDFIFSFFIIAILLIPLIVIGILVRIILGSPIIFSQVRPGKKSTLFKMYKFRSMTDARDSDGKLLPDAQRLTKFGLFLRKTSLDELPELINVLKGEMSLVGPRPLLVEYLPLYSTEQARRHEVRPGITGWAQINGRNAISWEEKFKLDIWYVDNQSFSLDIRILFLTIRKVLVRDGISAAGEATMPIFTGNKS